MAYANTPVKIPEVPGKITYEKKSDRTYVRYEIGRKYNSTRKTTTPQRKYIGMQIRTAPTLMLPNDNYKEYFNGDGTEKMTARERKAAQDYETMQKEFWTLVMMFDQLHYEFQFQTHKDPDRVVSAYKIRMINRILIPLKQIMEDTPYAAFLDIPREPVEVVTDEAEEDGGSGTTRLEGMDYSDVLMIMSQYKGAMNRFMSDI